ncbi:MAG: hypothetical protein BGO95_05295 [Micrococcales bacterium 73-13]|nr:MAG: hypothetical protein BGO95_05295 [Micrococcales bacterium 73-13]
MATGVRTASAGAAALRGVAAVVVGVGSAELVAGLLPSHPSPLAAVAGALVDIAPGWAKELAIEWFGTADKAVLVAVTVVVVLGIGAVAGLLERRRPPSGSWVLALLGVLALLVPAVRGTGVLGLLPGLVATVLALLVFRLLPQVGRRARRAPGVSTARFAPSEDGSEPEPEPEPEPGSGPDREREPQPGGASRRAFLAWAGGLTAAGVLAAVAGTTMSGLLRTRDAVAGVLRLPRPRTTLPPVPAGAELGIDGLAPVVTPVADFYRVDTAFIVPQLSADDWRLRVHGLVDAPFELGWEDLVALDFEEFDMTLMCVSNPVGGSYTGNARWLGTRLRPLIERAAPHAEADMVLSSSVDGWTASTPLEALRDPDRAAILAVAMNGEALPPEHGAPVRMVVPGLYGYVSATKWVVDLEVTRFDERTAYWTDRGWAPRGPVKLQSRIDVPRVGRDLSAGPTSIAGVAWYQHVGVAGVEVRVDGGDWRPAELATSLGVDTWVQWRLDWEAEPGVHRIAVRAIGANGEVQTDARAGVVPDGATGHHTISIGVA